MVLSEGTATSKVRYDFVCPDCDSKLTLERIETSTPLSIKTICCECYYPLIFSPMASSEQQTKIRAEYIRKTAFLIHSAKAEDKNLLDWFRTVVKLYGVSTAIIEEDRRSHLDWLQKSIDGIKSAHFVLVLLTKRYQSTDEAGLSIWKAPDKCYDEIAMSFALATTLGGKDILALIEKDVDPGRVLETRAWSYKFDRSSKKLKIDLEFFQTLDRYMDNI